MIRRLSKENVHAPVLQVDVSEAHASGAPLGARNPPSPLVASKGSLAVARTAKSSVLAMRVHPKRETAASEATASLLGEKRASKAADRLCMVV